MALSPSPSPSLSLLSLSLSLSLLSLSLHASASPPTSEFRPIIERTFYSPPFELGPGGVVKEWYPLEFPEGHFAVRSFNAELVDEALNPAPLNEVYLHHWTVRNFREGEPDPYILPSPSDTPRPFYHESAFYGPRGVPPMFGDGIGGGEEADCDTGRLGDIGAWFGVGSETRHTNTSFVAPYGVEIGNPNKAKQFWRAQIHAIDTRETVDPWGCLECLCDLYETNGVDGFGRPLPEGYVGGFLCCYTGMTCRLKDPATAVQVAPKKTRHLKYTIQYVPWDECVVPVKVYFVDVAGCAGEYDVPPCKPHGTVGECVHKKPRVLTFPKEGHLVTAEGHLHYGGIGISLRRQNGDMICDSVPRFGRGGEGDVGDEAGYVTGMGVCSFGREEVHVAANESVHVEAAYYRLGGHTGVMGQYVIGFAVTSDYVTPPNGVCLGPKALNGGLVPQSAGGGAPAVPLTVVLTFGGAMAAGVVAGVLAAMAIARGRREGGPGSFAPLLPSSSA